MKKLMILIFLMSLTQLGTAQFFKKLGEEVKKSAERATTRKTKRETEKKTETALDKVFNPEINKEKKEEKQNEEDEINATLEEETNNNNEEEAKKKKIEGLFGVEKAEYDNSYTFDIQATTRMVNFKKRKKDTVYMDQAHSKNAMGMSIPEQNVFIITDFNNGSSIYIDQEKKLGRAMSLDYLSKFKFKKKEEEEINEDDFEVKKTGKTKKLNGYLCEQYIIISEDTKSDVWLAPDVDFYYSDYANGFAKLLGEEHKETLKAKGYAMEMTVYEKEKKKLHMLVTAINNTPLTINLSDYNME